MARRINGGCTFRDARGQCPELAVDRGRCANHKLQAWKHQPGKETAASRGYDTIWGKLSRRYRREHPTCEVCGIRPSTATDHIRPLSEGGARLAWSNLQALCDPCHAIKTQQESARGRARTGRD